MSSRHVPTRRLKSGVLFSAPDDLVRVPHDELTRRPKRRTVNNVRNVAPGSGSSLVDEEVALDFSPAPDQQKPFAMFAKFVDSSSYGSSTRPMNPNISKQEKDTLCLPVLQVSLTATVEVTLSHMTLKQSFHNPSELTIKEARHTFPLYDGSVVTAFECTIGDERRLRGVVKPKEQARKEYKEAIRDQSKAAALLEEHTPDIFETSLGNIPPMTTVEIKIVYIQELKVVMMEGEVSEGIALIIPTSIAPRYSNPQSKGELPSELPHDKLDIEILVLNDGNINPEGCIEESGHLVYYVGTKMVESPQRLNGEHAVNEYYLWKHHSESPVLKKDFVFVFPMHKGHKMQSRATLSPPDESGLAAMMVSIRPNELFSNAIIPQSFSGEILFLLDQSWSMDDWAGNDEAYTHGSNLGIIRRYNVSGPTKIEVLREAMQLVLAGLPKTCSFNIISWGWETWALWEQSRQHSPENLREAKEYISEITANMGGTDLLRALKSTVQRRLDDSRSTQIVVLTDGELDPEQPMEFIWRTRQELQDKIRFFALGIGGNVPRNLIESIAELGGGFGDVVDTAQNPGWHARLNRLTKSALEPDTWDCDIDIGDGFQQQSLMDLKLNANALGAQPSSYFQAPNTITSLNPFRFTSIYFLVDTGKTADLPSEVTITTTTHGVKKRTYKLPVTPATIQDGTMHQLAAKAVLVDLENLVKMAPSSSRLVEQNAQIIGTRYCITSKWTSFVAVPQDDPTSTEGNIMEHYKALMDGVDITELLNAGSEYESDGSKSALYSSLPASSRRTAGVGTTEGNSKVGEWRRGRNQLRFGGKNSKATAPTHQEAVSVHFTPPHPVQDATWGMPPAANAETQRPAYELNNYRTVRRSTLKVQNEKGYRIQVADEGEYQPLSIRTSGPNAGEASVVTDKTKAATEEPVEEEERNEYPYSNECGLNPADHFATRRTPEPPGAQILSWFASSDSDITGEGSVTRNNPHAMDPLNWEIAVKYQNGQGLFELPEEARNRLNLHFCPNTRFVLSAKLSAILHDQGLEGVLCIQIIDSMMVTKCYQTHLALTEDIWDLMMERAQDAIAEAIGQDTLEFLDEILADSMMHQHYKAATGEEGQDGGLTGVVTCPVCDIRWQASRAFFCPFDHKPGTLDAFKKWGDFWEHQQDYGHLVCPREGASD